MKIQKILGILIVLIMLVNVAMPVLATNEVENKESAALTEKTETEETEEKETEKIEEKKVENNTKVKTLAETEESTEGEDAGEKSKTKTKETTEGDGTEEPDASEGDSKQDDGEDEVVWTDFSKAKFELKKDGISNAVIEVSGVTPSTGSLYRICLQDNSSVPTLSELGFENKLSLTYDKETKTFKCLDSSISNAVELNKDIYVSVIELNQTGDEDVILSGKKLTRYAEPKYSDAFWATFMTYDADQIVTNFTHARENNRKMQIKIGKITDKNILQKIKNQNSAGFADLLQYAKSNSGIYNETVNADKDDSFSIEYNAGTAKDTENKVIQLNGVEDEAYYYLYVKTDDENGKYYPNEAVTLALSSNTPNNEWAMFFYGANDFEWIDFGDGSDNTIATGTIPQTGENITIAFVIALVSVLGVVGYINYKKYRDVK